MGGLQCHSGKAYKSLTDSDPNQNHTQLSPLFIPPLLQYSPLAGICKWGSLQHLDALGEMDWQFLQADICWKQKDFPLTQQHVFDSIHLACFDQV